jgi:antitoxin component YwqK of YwqJK toxin-antitoxin module
MLRIDFELLDYEPHHAQITYEGKPFTGIVFEVDKQGLLMEQNCLEGQFHGLKLTYFQNKKINTESYVHYGLAHGTSRVWDINGQLICEQFYLVGVYIYGRFWQNGTLVHEDRIDKNHPNLKIIEREGFTLPNFD